MMPASRILRNVRRNEAWGDGTYAMHCGSGHDSAVDFTVSPTPYRHSWRVRQGPAEIARALEGVE